MKKIVASLLTVIITGFFAQSTTVFATEIDKPVEIQDYEAEEIISEEYKNFDGEYLKFTEENGIVTILDKETGEQIELEFQDENQAVLTDSNGETQELVRDPEGNVFVDGELETEAPIVESNPYENSNNISLFAASKWIYYQTVYTTSQTQGNLKSLALTLFGAVPYVGYISAIYAAIDAARSVGAPMLYIKVKQYHTKGYQFYRYENFFYTNSARTKLVKTVIHEKRMW